MPKPLFFLDMSIEPAILAARAKVRGAAEGQVIAELNRSLQSVEPGASIDPSSCLRGPSQSVGGFV